MPKVSVIAAKRPARQSRYPQPRSSGYTVALNRLDGVYYVDPRPEMSANPRLKEQISDFQHLLLHDLWQLASR